MPKKFFKKIIALAVGVLIIGCAGSPSPEPARMVIGKWHGQNINADGSKADWLQFVPQYNADKTNTKLWISNNADQICLLAEFKDPGIARQLTQGGLILAVETREKDAKPFSIQLKGRAPFSPRGEQPAPMPGVKLPDALIVSYPFSSGPVTMSMKEARATGIAFGLGDAGQGALIFEAVISLDAIFFDVPRTAGTVIDMTLSAKGQSLAMKRRRNSGGNKNRRPNGGPPGDEPPDQESSGTHHDSGKPDDMKQINLSDESFKAAVEITLAGPLKSPPNTEVNHDTGPDAI